MSKSKREFRVLSPDQIDIWPETYLTKAKAENALDIWCLRFKRQGYYRDNEWQKIPLEFLKERCQIIEIKPQTKEQ